MMLPPSGSGKPAGPLEPPLAQVDDLLQPFAWYVSWPS